MCVQRRLAGGVYFTNPELFSLRDQPESQRSCEPSLRTRAVLHTALSTGGLATGGLAILQGARLWPSNHFFIRVIPQSGSLLVPVTSRSNQTSWPSIVRPVADYELDQSPKAIILKTIKNKITPANRVSNSDKPFGIEPCWNINTALFRTVSPY